MPINTQFPSFLIQNNLNYLANNFLRLRNQNEINFVKNIEKNKTIENSYNIGNNLDELNRNSLIKTSEKSEKDYSPDLKDLDKFANYDFLTYTGNQQYMQNKLVNLNNNFYDSNARQNITDPNQIYFKDEANNKILFRYLLNEMYKNAYLINSYNSSLVNNGNIYGIPYTTNIRSSLLLDNLELLNPFYSGLNLCNFHNNAHTNNNHKLISTLNSNFLTNKKNDMNQNPYINLGLNKMNSNKIFSFNDGFTNNFDYNMVLEQCINLDDSGSKIFKCSAKNCGKSYKSKENLNLHIKNKHLGVKPYTCKFCTSKFSHRNGKNKLLFLLL